MQSETDASAGIDTVVKEEIISNARQQSVSRPSKQTEQQQQPGPSYYIMTPAQQPTGSTMLAPMYADGMMTGEAGLEPIDANGAVSFVLLQEGADGYMLESNFHSPPDGDNLNLGDQGYVLGDAAIGRPSFEGFSTKKPKGAVAVRPYDVFARKVYREIQAKRPGASFGEMSSLVSQEWRKLTAKQRQMYIDSCEGNRKPQISGFILYSKDVRPIFKRHYPEKSFGEMSKLIGNEWRNLSDEQRHEYEIRAEQIKNAVLLGNAVSQEDAEITAEVLRKVSARKNIASPKKAKTSRTAPLTTPSGPRHGFILYSKEMRTQMRLEFPQLTFGEISRKIGLAWRALPQEEKETYWDRAAQIADDKQAELQLKEYEPFQFGLDPIAAGGSKAVKREFIDVETASDDGVESAPFEPGDLYDLDDGRVDTSHRVQEGEMTVLNIREELTRVTRFEQQLVQSLQTKQASHGFIMYSKERRQSLKEENPQATFGTLSKLSGMEWKNLSQADKDEWERRSQEELSGTDVEPADLILPKPEGDGSIRVFGCGWKRFEQKCPELFPTVFHLYEHICAVHADAGASWSKKQGRNCYWVTCCKYRAEGKHFPNLVRLLKHIRAKHLLKSARITQEVRAFPDNNEAKIELWRRLAAGSQLDGLLETLRSTKGLPDQPPPKRRQRSANQLRRSELDQLVDQIPGVSGEDLLDGDLSSVVTQEVVNIGDEDDSALQHADVRLGFHAASPQLDVDVGYDQLHPETDPPLHSPLVEVPSDDTFPSHHQPPHTQQMSPQRGKMTNKVRDDEVI